MCQQINGWLVEETSTDLNITRFKKENEYHLLMTMIMIMIM